MTIQTFIALIADGAVIPIILIAGYALLFKVPKEGRFQAYARILMAGLTAYLIAKLLGSVYQPATERPFEILGVAAGASYLNNPGFPSDHALFTAFLTLAVWFETRRKNLTIILVVLTLSVCVGRVLALVHTPLDVIGGILVASLGALWYLQRDKKIENKLTTSPTRQKHQNSLQ
jgi:undecaprenyl-diphosphatase